MFSESSFGDLFQSAVDAFPFTRKRQHATDTVRITNMRWVPFLGTRTLFIRAIAENHRGGGGEYNTIITFKGVRYHETAAPGLVEIVASDGHNYFLEPLNRDTDILCRCSCPDFTWRFNFTDHVDHSLYGRVRRRYESAGGPPVNPTNSPGLCKHLMKFFYSLEDSGLVLPY